MSSKRLPEWLKVLGTLLLLLVPVLLLGWFLPGSLDLFGGSGSTERRKQMSAEAKFLWLVFGVLLVVGLGGWFIWRKVVVR